MSSDPDSLVFSKSLALVQKTKKRVAQVDSSEFPTSSSEHAKALLLETLNTLGDSAFWPAMNPEALYGSLIQIQVLVEQLEASNSAHISWPLVSCCDHIWKQLFPNGEAQIFYSVMTEHNYGIGSFSHRLKSLIEKVLPPSQITKILKNQNLYCLQLASLEDENLPLYANISHEFGHALYWFRDKAILQLLAEECDAAYKLIVAELNAMNAPLAPKRRTKTAWIIHHDTPIGFLLGLGTEPRRNSSEKGDFNNFGPLANIGIVNEAKRTRLASVRFQEALSLDRLQMTSGCSVAAEPESLRNLSQGRTWSTSGQAFPDKVENILLSLGQPVHILPMWIVFIKHDVKSDVASGGPPLNTRPARPVRRLDCQAGFLDANFTSENAIRLP